ncbi:MAG: nucleoside-diphosphate kinase [Planctomycetaceae bacterium]|nr:nucleoside-diphosphate kinase [Planctomycetaceae bacterium]
MTQNTLILIKPDAVQRGLVGEIISRFERKGLKIVAFKMLYVTPDLARCHYAEHVDNPYYQALEDYMTGSPTVAMIVSGPEAIDAVRLMVGPTNGLTASPGTIRGDFSTSYRLNLVHASDSEVSAEREIATFFDPSELIDYDLTLAQWLTTRTST